jgi:hypothetical protein
MMTSFQSGANEDEGRDEQPEAGDDIAAVRLSDPAQGLL